MEEEGRPLPEEVTEASVTRRTEAQGGDPFAGLINQLQVQERKKLNLPEVGKFYRMLVDLESETHRSIPPELHETIRNVTTGFGFLAFDQLPRGQKVAFIQHIRGEQKYRQIDRLSLTPEQAEILQRVASAVNIDYDPGEPEDDTKRTFSFAGIEDRVPDGYHLYDEPR
ncbi:MAG TPA: hypothetical protein VEL49_03795 [Ktedonobacteraceae bacterium]|nr:hypothetical protein [Ktedonobacteraceae bacterium]